jgi:hypothetical protein
MKTCPCSGKARCAECTISVREDRGCWSWRDERRGRGDLRTLGIFSGRVSLDGSTVVPFAGPGPVRLDQPLEPGTEVRYSLVEVDGVLVAERVRVAA